jgi:hypothetical protein
MLAWFLNRKIRTELLVAASAAMFATAGIGVFAIRQLSVVNAQSTLIADA